MTSDMRKVSPAKASETSPNVSLTANCNDPKTVIQCTTGIDNYRASQALLSAISGLSRSDAQNALRAVEQAELPPGDSQAFFNALRATVDIFPMHADRVGAASTVARHLIAQGELTPTALDYLAGPDSPVPIDQLIQAVQVEALGRQCIQAVDGVLGTSEGSAA